MIRGIQLLLLAFFFLATSTEASEINKSFELSENLSQSGEKECLSEIHGSLTYKGYRYVKQIENDNQTITDEFIATLELSGIVGQRFKYFFTPVYRIDNANLARGVLEHFEEDSQNRNMINIKEARIEIGDERLLLSIGKQFFSWGEADGYNPSDNLCAKDFTDLFDDEKIGVTSFEVKYVHSGYILDVAVIPLFTPNRLPVKGSRWFIADPLFSNIEIVRKLPAQTMKNTQMGIRLRKNFKGWDVSLSYYDGIRHMPIPILTSPQVLTLTFPKIRVLAGGFSNTFGPVEFHGEFAQTFTDSDEMESYFQEVIGINYSTRGIISDHTIRFVLEYAREWITESNPSNELNKLFDISRIFSNSILTKIDYEFSSFTKILMKGVYNLDKHDYYLRISLYHDFSDAFKGEIGFDFLNGPKDSFFGQYSRNDRGLFYIKYLF
jgi:hypothetical protein